MDEYSFDPAEEAAEQAMRELEHQYGSPGDAPPAAPVLPVVRPSCAPSVVPMARPKPSAAPPRPSSAMAVPSTAATASVVMTLSCTTRLLRYRLRGKQVPPPGFWQTAACQSALGAEAWTELTALSEDARRQHVHYTHVRTRNPADRQPESFTRQSFWEHLERCYLAVYPEAANATGSILMFGAVAKEVGEVTSEEHHHAPTYSSIRHYWKKIADISYNLYRVKLNAVAHDGYYSMYSYITKPSNKKPLETLDQEVFLSKAHPRGKMLKKLLEAGAVHAKAVAGKASKRTSDSGTAAEPGSKRFRSGELFGLVKTKGIRTAMEVQSLACKLACDGDLRLAEFCTTVGNDKLTHMVQGAVSVLEAPKSLALKGSSRMELLRWAAREHPCTCNGIWAPGAHRVLENNGENVRSFCLDVCRAIELGAKRGCNMAIIGEPGCAKSMVFEPFDDIFPVMGKPDSKSSFPLTGVLDSKVLVWQDWKHSDSIVQFEDLLSLLVGERIEIRVPNQKNVSFRNESPLFFTSNSPLYVVRPDPQAMQRLNSAMSERFCTRVWQVPFPKAERKMDFPRCSKCCALFYLECR